MVHHNKHKLIVLTGGGTAGPVAPLLAVVEELRAEYPEVRFLFIGTSHGPERVMAEGEKIPFVSVPAGKLRRYWSVLNIFAPFLVIAGFVKALVILYKAKPACAVGASGFVQVPVLWAAWVLRIPVIIHQQDVDVSLANSLCAPIAKRVTVTFEASVTDFSSGLGIYKESLKPKAVWTGNPVRRTLLHGSRNAVIKFFHLKQEMPIVLVTGGGTGAAAINGLVAAAVPYLTRSAQIIHLTGKGKSVLVTDPHYRHAEFSTDMASLYAASDVVVARAGLGTMSELAFLGKAAIIIPMPDTHQEQNAALLWGEKAAVVLDQKDTTPELFASSVRKLLVDQKLRHTLQTNIQKIMPKDGAVKLARIVWETATTHV